MQFIFCEQQAIYNAAWLKKLQSIRCVMINKQKYLFWGGSLTFREICALSEIRRFLRNSQIEETEHIIVGHYTRTGFTRKQFIGTEIFKRLP